MLRCFFSLISLFLKNSDISLNLSFISLKSDLNKSFSFFKSILSVCISVIFLSNFSRISFLNSIILFHCESKSSIFFFNSEENLSLSARILIILSSTSLYFSLFLNSNLFNKSLQYNENFASVKFICCLN